MSGPNTPVQSAWFASMAALLTTRRHYHPSKFGKLRRRDNGKVFILGTRLARGKDGTLRDPYLHRLALIENIREKSEALIKLYAEHSDFPDI